MYNPLISIIMPCYKQAEFLDDALQSVMDSTYQNWECVIINDGSPDNTVQIAEKWMKIDSRIKLVNQSNRGVSTARNEGIKAARGEYILPLDADDKISSEYIDLGIKAFMEDPELKLVYCKAHRFGLINGFWYLKDFTLKKLSRFNMIFNSAIYKKKDWEKCGGYDPNMIEGIEDWEFWINLLKDNGKVLKLDHIGYYYHIRSKSRTTNLNNQKLENLYRYMCKKHIDFFLNQYGSFISLEKELEESFRERRDILKSKKFSIDLFLKNLFGFTIFKSKLLR